MKPSKAAIDALKVTVYGAGTVLASTVASCAIAVVIERSAHRTLYRFFPHLYADVKYANGLPHLQYRSREGDENTCNSNNDKNNQVIEDIELITQKLENSEAIHRPATDTEIASSSRTTITSMINSLHRETEAVAKNGDSFWNSEGVLRRTNKYDSSTTTPISMATSSPSPFESYANVINNEGDRLSVSPERVSEIVRGCAMTAG